MSEYLIHSILRSIFVCNFSPRFPSFTPGGAVYFLILMFVQSFNSLRYAHRVLQHLTVYSTQHGRYCVVFPLGAFSWIIIAINQSGKL